MPLEAFLWRRIFFVCAIYQKGCRKFGNAMEQIRIDLLQENRKEGKHRDKKLKIILELYRKIYYERQFGLNFVERENQTLLAITKNPDKNQYQRRKINQSCSMVKIYPNLIQSLKRRIIEQR